MNNEAADSPRPGAFHALRYRNFRLFFFGQLVSVAGSWMQGVAQQWLVFDLTRSAAWLGIVAGAAAIPYIGTAMFGGLTADRFPRRRILLITQSMAMALAVALAILASGRWMPIEPWHIAAIAALSGIVNAFNMPAQQALIPRLVDDRAALGNAIALNSLMFNLARFLGPLAAGLVLVRAGPAACFGVNALSFLAVIASLSVMRVHEKPDTGEARSFWDGWRFIRRNTAVMRVIALVGCASLFAWSSTTLFPVFAARFNTGAAGFTGLMAAQGVGAAAGGLGAAYSVSRLPRRLMVYLGALLLCVFLMLFTVAPTYPLALITLALAGFAMITFGINANTKVQEDVSDELRGRVMAIYSLVFLGLMPVGGFEIGMLAEAFGPVAAVRVNITLCAVAAASLFAVSAAELRRTADSAA